MIWHKGMIAFPCRLEYVSAVKNNFDNIATSNVRITFDTHINARILISYTSHLNSHNV